MVKPEPGDAIALARLHGLHEPWPAVCRPPGTNRKSRWIDGRADGAPAKPRISTATCFSTASELQANSGSVRCFTSAVLLPALPDFKRRQVTPRIEATHQYADFNASRVDVAIRYGREHSTRLKCEPLVAVKGLPVCAPALVRQGLQTPEDLSRQILIHLTTQPRSWSAWLKEAGLTHRVPRGHRWLDSVPAMLETAEHGLGVTLAMAPLIKDAAGLRQETGGAVRVRRRLSRDDLSGLVARFQLMYHPPSETVSVPQRPYRRYEAGIFTPAHGT
jgi:DNA-binding transcriptional LysR family regulator